MVHFRGFIAILVTLFGAQYSFGAVLSPFFSQSQGELESVVETDSLVIIVELDYSKLKAGDYQTCYVARIWDKASRNWTSIEGVSSKNYLDGGSREISFLRNGAELKIELPALWKRAEKGEIPKGTLGGHPFKILRYGLSYGTVAFSDVLQLIKPLYSAQEQKLIEESGEIRDFGDPEFLKNKSFIRSMYSFIVNGRASSRSPIIEGTPNCAAFLSDK